MVKTVVLENNRKNGRHCTIEVPCGTVIFNQDTNEQITDLTEHGQKITIAKGGFGGREILSTSKYKPLVKQP